MQYKKAVESQLLLNMEQGGPSKRTQPPLVDKILEYGQIACDPASSEETRHLNKSKLEALLKTTGTLVLIPALNLLIQPERTNPWLRALLVSTLATLPLRERGVQNTIEFVLSVHPSSAGYNTSANAGKGSGISHEALNAASRLLSSPPSGMPPEKWFSGIAPQLFALLEGEGEPEMDRAAAFIIGFGILGRKQYGAPGMAGWKAFVEPIFRYIDPAIVPIVSSPMQNSEDIIALGASKTLVSSSELAKSLRRLTVLVTTHPHPSLTKRLLAPILLPLWSLSSWRGGDEFTDNNYRKPAMQLLRTFLQLSSSSGKSAEAGGQLSPSKNLTTIIKNLMFDGRSDTGRLRWIYSLSQDGGICIQERKEQHQSMTDASNLLAIDAATVAFVNLTSSLTELDTEISQLFVTLCRRWLEGSKEPQARTVFTHVEPSARNGEMENKLIEAKIMQTMMTRIPGKLVDDSQQVLELVNQVLAQFVHGQNDGEDTVSIALSLLNLVLTSVNFRETTQIKPVLKLIKASLASISKRSDLETSSTAQNLLLLLRFRSTVEDPVSSISTSTDQKLEDRKSHSLAMSYLTATDSPPPVRVQGLEILSNLVKANSSVIDVPAVLVLFSSLLQDSEEYIYLRVIKSFIELSNKHPKSVMKDLIDRYVDQNEDAELDQRLRFGEALLQVIQNSKATFSGDTARSVCEGLLSVASRRGYRPKSEKEQEKRNRLKRKKDQEAEDAWDGEVPQIWDDPTPENEIMAQIVSGWESKRGTEDVRIRASALSILGSAIEANVAGIGSSLISTTVDLSIHVLTLEPEGEKGILRRSAILLIMSFVRALDEARKGGKKLGFGFVGQSLDDVQRILEYVVDTDNDGLVRQHARDVVEGLQTWQLNSLLPSQNEHTEIQELAGLSINPGLGEPDSRMRPRIEEIE